MEYVTSRKLSEAKKVLKSVVVKNADCSVPNADSETLTKASGNAIIKQATTQAEEIKKKAIDEVNLVTEKARKDGFAQGQVDARKRYETLMKAMALALDMMEEIKREMSENLRESIIALAVEIAGNVLKNEITSDPSIIRYLADDVLSKIAPARDVAIRFNTADYEVLKDFHREMESAAGFPDKFHLTHDSTLGRGDVVVQYERGTIDARIVTQLENVARLLMENPCE